MRSPAEDIARLIADGSLGSFAASSGWSVNVGHEPVSPQTTITVYSTGGAGADTDELDVYRPTIQVRVRGKGYRAVYEKLDAIRTYLQSRNPSTIEGAHYASIHTTSDILELGMDENRLDVMTLNLMCVRQKE